LEQALDRVRQAARRYKDGRMTALWHHVYDVNRLYKAYREIRRKAAAGVDGETWKRYGENLEERLQALSDRLRRGAYKPKPVRRTYVPKTDGGRRPIGIPALEDKIVQRATVEVLNAVYEEDFVGFSYGFRPRRNQHHALDALWVGTVTRKVNWVLDLDIRGFFDAIDHEWMVRMVEHRIGDRRVIRHIKKWLKAGVMEDGTLHEAKSGTPQGGSISPLLANVYLHYCFDLWAQSWRRRHARGEVVIVRYADDAVVGFQHRTDAERFRKELEQRLRKFNLELHPKKTRLVEFGRYAADRRSRRKEGRPETFTFLGFVHYCGETKSGRFVVYRRTDSMRMGRKLHEVKAELRRRMHDSVAVQGAWLRTVVRGYYQYHAVPGNGAALSSFRWAVQRHWYRTLLRRSQKKGLTLAKMQKLAKRWLPTPRIIHPWPLERLRV